MDSKPVAAIRETISDRMASIWWTILLRGIFAMLLAICAILWPQKTIGLLVKLLGVYFLVDGITGAVGAYRGGSRGLQWGPTIVSLALGLTLLFWTGVSAKLLLILIGVWLVVQGVMFFLNGQEIKSQTGERTIVRLVGGLMVLVGLLFIFWTDTGVVAVSWLLGIGTLCIGLGLIFLAIRLKQLRDRLRSLVHPE